MLNEKTGYERKTLVIWTFSIVEKKEPCLFSMLGHYLTIVL